MIAMVILRLVLRIAGFAALAVYFFAFGVYGIMPVLAQVGGTNYFSAIGGSVTTQGTLVKNAQGVLQGIYVTNDTPIFHYLKFYDSTTAPTCGSGTPVLRIGLPANNPNPAPATLGPALGIQFWQGIGYCLVQGNADNNTVSNSVAGLSITVNLFFQ